MNNQFTSSGPGSHLADLRLELLGLDFDGEVPEACVQAVEAIDSLLAQLAAAQKERDAQTETIRRLAITADEAMETRDSLKEELTVLTAELSLKQQTIDYWRLSAERAENCGQDKACATPPGCNRHWEERNRELVAELAAARGKVERLREALVDLDACDNLLCIVDPPCGNCVFCNARAALYETKGNDE